VVGVERQIGTDILDTIRDGNIAAVFEEADKPPHAAEIDRITKLRATITRTAALVLREPSDGCSIHAGEREAATAEPVQEMTGGAAVIYERGGTAQGLEKCGDRIGRRRRVVCKTRSKE
jgi:hypothetical protein